MKIRDTNDDHDNMSQWFSEMTWYYWYHYFHTILKLENFEIFSVLSSVQKLIPDLNRERVEIHRVLHGRDAGRWLCVAAIVSLFIDPYKFSLSLSLSDFLPLSVSVSVCLSHSFASMNVRKLCSLNKKHLVSGPPESPFIWRSNIN